MIDDATSQSVLDSLTIVPACLMVVGTTRPTLVMPNLMSIASCLTIVNNPLLSDVDISVTQGVGGSVTVSDNTSAANVASTSSRASAATSRSPTMTGPHQ